jgi:hypothetical protein
MGEIQPRPQGPLAGMPDSHTCGGPLLRLLQASTDAPKRTIEERHRVTARHIVSSKAEQLHQASSSSRGAPPDVTIQMPRWPLRAARIGANNITRRQEPTMMAVSTSWQAALARSTQQRTRAAAGVRHSRPRTTLRSSLKRFARIMPTPSSTSSGTIA